MTAEEAILDELTTYYHGDDLRVDDAFRRALPLFARASAERLADSKAPGLVSSLEGLKQRTHPLHRMIGRETYISWTDNDLLFSTFTQLVDLIVGQLPADPTN